MAHRCVRKLRLSTSSSFNNVRHLHASPARHDALAVPFADYSTASSSSSPQTISPLDIIRNQKAEALRSYLSARSPNPHRVWGGYLELLQFYGTDKVPLDIHQSVLRRCAPPPTHIRAIAAQRRRAREQYTDPGLFESRFQKVISNIRRAGDTPTLDDYHCVLGLFAAIGHYPGSMMVLHEIGRMGLMKEPETYALCLQAMCHRLTLPVWHEDRPGLVKEVTAQAMDLMEEMTANGVPYELPIVELSFRILKETMQMEGFTTLLRSAYGIDLAYPDRSPLENWTKRRDASQEGNAADSVAPLLPTQLPFTLSAFNTALDYIGRAGDVSKLVQLFEVVTTPLPSTTSNATFLDDDDDDFGISNPQVAPYKPPHVVPNTTTFRILLQGLSRAGHAVLARHYLLLAIELERSQGRQLREWVQSRSPDHIPAPRLAVNRGLFLPVFGLANTDKDVELMRWIAAKAGQALHVKRREVRIYEAVRQQWIRSGVYRAVRAAEDDLTSDVDEDLPTAAGASSRFSTFFNPSSSAHQPPEAEFTADPASPPNPFDVPTSPPTDVQRKLDIDVHLKILRRDIDDLEDFIPHVDHVIGRTVQRIKERLGRRVWDEKDIYMRHVGDRTEVSKEEWQELVNYRSQAEVEARRKAVRIAKARERERERRRLAVSSSSNPPPVVRAADVRPEDVERDEPPHKSPGL